MSTRDSDAGSADLPQAERKHPEEWEQDLNPDHMAGQNIGEHSGDREQGLPTAYDEKAVHRALHADFEDDELKQIPILRTGQRLQQGASYLDLRDPGRQEFTAMGDMEAGEENRYVPKEAVPYSLWNRLTGVENPERIPERGPRREE